MKSVRWSPHGTSGKLINDADKEKLRRPLTEIDHATTMPCYERLVALSGTLRKKDLCLGSAGPGPKFLRDSLKKSRDCNGKT